MECMIKVMPDCIVFCITQTRASGDRAASFASGTVALGAIADPQRTLSRSIYIRDSANLTRGRGWGDDRRGVGGGKGEGGKGGGG